MIIEMFIQQSQYGTDADFRILENPTDNPLEQDLLKFVNEQIHDLQVDLSKIEQDVYISYGKAVMILNAADDENDSAFAFASTLINSHEQALFIYNEFINKFYEL